MSISNKCCSFEICIDQTIKQKQVSTKSFIYHSTLIIRNVSCAPNHIKMISEGSHDTKDWNRGWWKFSIASQ